MKHKKCPNELDIAGRDSRTIFGIALRTVRITQYLGKKLASSVANPWFASSVGGQI